MDNNYSNYKVEDFIQDDRFIRWVREEDEEAVAFWEKWTADHPERATDVQAAREFLQSLAISEARVDPVMVDQMWNKIDRATEKTGKVRRMSRLYYLAAAAASILLLVYVAFFTGTRLTSISTDYAEQRTVYLPDSSIVFLNAGSRVQFPESGWSSERKLRLSGEAFFEVRKGSSFVVETGLGEVRVLGTSFNVYQRGKAFRVSCYTGKVAVSPNWGAEGLTLSPGNGFRGDAGRQEASEFIFDPQQPSDWRTGEFLFEREPLSVVFAEMERQFDISIDYPATVGQDIYSGFFNRSSLENALNSVCYPMELTYAIKGDQVLIRKD